MREQKPRQPVAPPGVLTVAGQLLTWPELAEAHGAGIAALLAALGPHALAPGTHSRRIARGAYTQLVMGWLGLLVRIRRHAPCAAGSYAWEGGGRLVEEWRSEGGPTPGAAACPAVT